MHWSRLRRLFRSRGAGLLEILLAVTLIGILSLPVLENVGIAVKETAVSQEYMLAEAVALGALADAMAIPLDQMRRDLPYFQPLVPDAKDRARTQKLEIYRSALAPDGPIKGHIEVDEVDGEGQPKRRATESAGMFKYQVTLEWPVHPGSTETRTFALIRFRCPADVSAHVRFPDDIEPHVKTIAGGTL